MVFKLLQVIFYQLKGETMICLISKLAVFSTLNMEYQDNFLELNESSTAIDISITYQLQCFEISFNLELKDNIFL